MYVCISDPAEVVFFFETEMLVPNSPTRGTRTAEINMHFQPKFECREPCFALGHVWVGG